MAERKAARHWHPFYSVGFSYHMISKNCQRRRQQVDCLRDNHKTVPLQLTVVQRIETLRCKRGKAKDVRDVCMY